MQNKLIQAGYIPFPAWLLFVTLAGFFAPEYSPIASHASVMTLEEGIARPIVNLAALLSGAALIVFGAGLWMASRRAFAAGAFCWIVFGVSMIANGIWPMGSPMHGLYIIGIFNIVAPALSLLETRDERLRNSLYNVTVVASLAGVLYLWLMLTGFDPAGYSGVTQRVFGSISFLWPLFFAHHYSRALK